MHEPTVLDGFLGILPAPLEIFPEFDDLGMEGKGEETLLLEVIFNLFYHEAVFGYLNCEVDLFNGVLQFVDCQFVQFGDVNKIIAFLFIVVPFNRLSWFAFVQAPISLADVDV